MSVRVELRHLRYFVALAEDLHFGAAARRLRIAQPSLSQQIRSLEKELGVTLLERANRGTKLTEAGAVYLLEARAILASVETAATDARRAERGEVGRLAIGFLSLAALDVLPPLLERFRKINPDVSITLLEQSTEEQMRGVLDGTLDLGIVREPAPSELIASRHLLRDAQVVAVPATHRLAANRKIAMEQLRDEAFILFPRTEGTAMYDRIISACAHAGFSPRVVQEARIVTTMIGLVAAGLGVAILPSIAARVGQPAVIYLPLAPRLMLDTRLIWHPGTFQAKPAVRAFLDTKQHKRSDA
jgi:DNA-binding transcriptional LysR family regulator